MQLVEGDSVVMYDYFKNREIGPDQVHERFGVGPERVIDVQALAGDSTDNVPGVPGIGVKTAAQLINDYGDLDPPARTCRRDQATQAAPEPDRACRNGAPFPRSRDAAAGCALADAAGGACAPSAGAGRASRLLPGERLQVDRRAARDRWRRGNAGRGGGGAGRDGPPPRRLPAGDGCGRARGLGREGARERRAGSGAIQGGGGA